MPIRNEKHEIIGYCQEHPVGQVKIRDRHGELVGWAAFGQTRARDGFLVSFQESEGLPTDTAVARSQDRLVRKVTSSRKPQNSISAEIGRLCSGILLFLQITGQSPRIFCLTIGHVRSL